MKPRLTSGYATMAAAALATTIVGAQPALAAPTPGTPALLATQTSPTEATTPRAHRGDVDGDGRADTVTIRRNAAGLLVSVRTARGARSSYTVVQGDYPPVQDARKWFYGATAFDGVRGQELFIWFGVGAHTPAFQILTWRKGRLVAQPNPSPGTNPLLWSVDSSAGYGVGQRLVHRGLGRDLVTTRAERSATDVNRFTGTSTTYRWKAGAWRRIATTKVSLTEAQAYDVFGWHVPGLPVFVD